MEQNVMNQVAPTQHLLLNYQSEIESELDTIMIRYDLTPDEMATALTTYASKIGVTNIEQNN